jgi:hypothetical protein
VQRSAQLNFPLHRKPNRRNSNSLFRVWGWQAGDTIGGGMTGGGQRQEQPKEDSRLNAPLSNLLNRQESAS